MKASRTLDEVGDQADVIFETRIKALSANSRPDDFLAIGINSGEYEMAAADVTPGERLRQRHPDAVIFLRRVGSEDAYFAGGGYRA